MKKKSDDSSYWGKSLRALPWDKKEKTHSQTLISSTVHEWYDAKHRETSFEEIELINSIIINSCPYCGSARFIKAGHNGLLQRYKCSECDGRFSALTNTIFDSTNKASQAGDIDIVEEGHAKVDEGKDIFNYSVAYDRNNREPLFYESYPGSIVDVSQLQYTLEKTAAYGYRHVGFVLDRGYFSKGNIHYMDEHGFEFILMVKGMKKFVSELILENQGTFENDRKNSIRAFKTSGITVRHTLYPSDQKERYFHIYYSDIKRTKERDDLETKIDRLGKKLKEFMGLQIKPGKEFRKYFDLIFFHEGEEDEKFMFAQEKTDVINQELKLCGYFVIITSEEMTAEQALTLYKSRDGSEKLFRGDKSYLGARSERVYSNEAFETKIFIEFVAMIIRCKMYTLLKDEMTRNEKKQNYMTVPAAIKVLEKIELIRGGDSEYHMDYAVTATQKAILKAFDMNAKSVIGQAREISSDLARIEMEQLEKRAADELA